MSNCLCEIECQRFIDCAEKIGFTHQSSRGAAFGEAYRDNHRVSILDTSLSQQLWSALRFESILAYTTKTDKAIPISLNPNFRFYRYGPGQRFGRHIDESVSLSTTEFTEYTLLIYLSTPVGGETVFYDRKGRKSVIVQPRAGLMLLHRHGSMCLEHEGAPVLHGNKYVLRSDVVYKKLN